MKARVLVTGAGVDGLTQALVLARRGRKVSVLEPGPGLSARRQAVALSRPALAELARLGVLEALLAQGARGDRWAWLAPDGVPVTRLTPVSASPLPFCWHVDRARAVPVLAAALRRLPGCEIVFEAAVSDTRRHAQGVVAVLADGQCLHGADIVACRDAAAPYVRHARTTVCLERLNPALRGIDRAIDAGGGYVILRLPDAWHLFMTGQGAVIPPWCAGAFAPCLHPGTEMSVSRRCSSAAKRSVMPAI